MSQGQENHKQLFNLKESGIKFRVIKQQIYFYSILEMLNPQPSAFSVYKTATVKIQWKKLILLLNITITQDIKCASSINQCYAHFSACKTVSWNTSCPDRDLIKQPRSAFSISSVTVTSGNWVDRVQGHGAVAVHLKSAAFIPGI